MCNKRRTLSNINFMTQLLARLFPHCIILITILALFACTPGERPMEKDRLILDEYPEIGEAIANRDFNRLLEFTGHGEGEISRLAWRALGKTPANDLDSFLQIVLNEDSDEAWFALSLHQLESAHLETIMNAFDQREISSSAVCDLFYRQGGEQVLRLLMEYPATIYNNPKCALAAGGILNRVDADDETMLLLFTIAFDADDDDVRRNLIYGFYRISAGGPPFVPAIANEVSRKWAGYGVGRDVTIDKYMVRILGQRTLPIVYHRLGEDMINDNIQLAIEMARAIRHSTLPTVQDEILDYLFTHRNDLVRIELLESLSAHGDLPAELLVRVEEEITRPTRNDLLFLQSINLLQLNNIDVRPYSRKLEFMVSANPYLLDRALPLLRILDGTDEVYFERLQVGIEAGGIKGMHSMRALGSFWRESRDAFRNAQIRRLLDHEFERGERSVIAGMQPILMDDDLIMDDEYTRLYSALQRFVERGDLDNYRMMRNVLESRFSDRFDSPDMLVDEAIRIPDWDRLYRMGTRPYWILETNRGTIEVRLDPKTAPFTVSSIDSLTRAGAYNGVVFHRVVKNFVIQGGDFDRRDGFGGPGYRLPTEPSFNPFERGAAGIASSGTDTEGSQFFFMHNRAPHLDGNYTRFGEVVRGMDVVDKIQIGDVVHRARMSIR
jgi:cyclophilin family peptidyl-prolyl cis-trans isomerase